MLNITNMAEWLHDETEWQETPYPLTEKDYINMVIGGIKRLFVDTGRSEQYNEDLYQLVVIPDGEYFGYDADFPLDERMYIEICAKINFFRKVQTDVNNKFGYSTDAITVTNADKPYVNLKNTIGDLDNDRRIVYYKMVRYTLGVS